MYTLTATLTAAATALLAGTAVAQTGTGPYNIYAAYTDEGGQYRQQRVWYGDGRMYVGAAVPAGVQTAVNFTAPNERATLLYIRPAMTGGGGGGAVLPDPTFLTLSDAPGAAEPLTFAHSAAGLSETTDRLFWSPFAGTLYPLTNEGVVISPPRYFLDATDAPGTYVVKWEGEGTRRAGARRGRDPIVGGAGGQAERLARDAVERRDLAGVSVELKTVPE